MFTWAANKNLTYRRKLKHMKEFTRRTERAEKKNITTKKYRCINKQKSTTQEVNSNGENSVQRPRDALPVFTNIGLRQNENQRTTFTQLQKALRLLITHLNLLGISSSSISSRLDWRTAHDNAADKWIKEWNFFEKWTLWNEYCCQI